MNPRQSGATVWSVSESDDLTSALSVFPEASSQLLAMRELLRRIDSKYVVHGAQLAALVCRLGTDYAALRVPSGNIATYQNLYWDSPDLCCFHDHRRGRRIRHKIRYRHYPDRMVSFLEVKTKRNELLTDKLRLNVTYRCEASGEREQAFLHKHIGPLAEILVPVVYVNYRRASLVGIRTNERITIDFDLEVVTLDGERRSLWPISVIEVKQSPFSLATPVMRALAAARIRPRSISKYVVAIATTRPGERKNRLLPTLRGLERIAR